MALVGKPITSFKQLQEVAKKRGPKKVSVAVAQEKVVLQAIKKAEDLGLIDAILVGNQDEILKLGEEFGWKIPVSKIVNELEYYLSIRRAAEMVRDKEASMIMKGKATSADMYRTLLDKEMGMRTGRLLSQVLVFKVPGFDRHMFMSDASMFIAPDLKQKAEICRNAIDVAHALGIKTPKVAALSALELVNPDMPSTVDAANLTLMNRRNQIKGAIIDGPIAMDAAVAAWAAEEKGFESPVAGCTDIFICPNIESANIGYRCIIYFAKAESGGIVVGAKAPIIVVSRAEPIETKINSICLGILIATKE
ncbi:MAG: bifunctional enoyl-CoA hydratase/phosphate acetyltransferase [Dehalococcoidia bacterium]|nr:MAG: bifunctional enoyl-CoA hydratase/phosphate acetyltransferase [Dehalococcoidia bacterium]